MNTVIIPPQHSGIQFYALKGKININKQPRINCTISTYPLTTLTYTDEKGMFVWFVPRDTTVMLVVKPNSHRTVGYLVKFNSRKRFLNIKIDSAAALRSIKNQAEWNKNEPYNSANIEKLYTSGEFRSFMNMWNGPEPIIK